MPQASTTRFSSASSDILVRGASSPCTRAALRLRSRRPTALPAAYRDMISLDPFIGPTMNGRISELERRVKLRSLHTPPRAARKGASRVLTAPPNMYHREPPVVEKLKSRIQRLERSKSKLQERFQDTKEALQDARMEAESAQTELLRVEEAAAALVKAEAKVKKLQDSTNALRRDGDRFRRWWITEYHSLQVVLKLIPNPEDVEAISASARARFMDYSK